MHVSHGGLRWRRHPALLVALAAGTAGLAGCQYADDVGLVRRGVPELRGAGAAAVAGMWISGPRTVSPLVVGGRRSYAGPFGSSG